MTIYSWSRDELTMISTSHLRFAMLWRRRSARSSLVQWFAIRADFDFHSESDFVVKLQNVLPDWPELGLFGIKRGMKQSFTLMNLRT
jgi:hypothetical protein